jgi:hypothetical protein
MLPPIGMIRPLRAVAGCLLGATGPLPVTISTSGRGVFIPVRYWSRVCLTQD